MPTTEERLAALEKQMAAWMDQRPTTYYTHQYSGEEIDAAVGRAVTGGAIDQAAGTFVRPNLLENWYFGRPVDQREGKIIPAGKSYYTTPDITLPEVGKTDKAYTVIEIKNYSGYGQRATISISGTVYYVWDQDAVRGYTGKVYGVDRWSSTSNIVTMVVGDDGLTVSSTAESGAVEICQYFESYIKAGTILTLSAIVSKTEASQNGILRVKVYGGGADLQANLPARAMDHELVSVTNAARADVIGCVMRISNGDGYTVHAIKLELGPTQTLAHREGDKWVLNEVPEYGEQLRRCQRYFRRIAPAQYAGFARGCAYNANSVRVMIPFETMRTSPSLKLNNAAGIFASNGATGDVFGLSFSSVWTSPESITFDVSKTGAFVDGKEYILRGDQAGYIDVIADL